MSKYKVGDEILIKAKITDIEPADYYPYVVTTLRGQRTWATDDDIAEASVDEYNRGLEDAWELARKIVLDASKGGISERDMGSIFGEKWTVSDILKNFTPQKALAKLEAYEKEQDEIKVGDVVECSKRIFVVTYIASDSIRGIDEDGKAFATSQMKYVKKTGKHINITEILAELKGE